MKSFGRSIPGDAFCGLGHQPLQKGFDHVFLKRLNGLHTAPLLNQLFRQGSGNHSSQFARPIPCIEKRLEGALRHFPGIGGHGFKRREVFPAVHHAAR